MNLTPGLTSAVDLLHKLQRDVGRLNKEITSDDFFNFVIAGNSLIDWVKHDTSLPASARTPKEIDRLHKEPWLKVCGDLATASRHYTLTRRKAVVTRAESKSGFGKGRYGTGAYGVGEDSIEIRINNNSEWIAQEFACGVLLAWLQFFERRSIEHGDSLCGLTSKLLGRPEPDIHQLTLPAWKPSSVVASTR